MHHRIYSAVFALLCVQVSFAGTSTVTFSTNNGSQVLYTLSSTSPTDSVQQSNGAFFATMPLVINYPAYTRGSCPSVTSYSMNSNSLYTSSWNATLNWGAGGTYNFAETDVQTTVNSSVTAITITGGTAVESGTGSVGSGYSRTTNLSTVGGTYAVTPTLTVTRVGGSSCDPANPFCLAWASCKFDLRMVGSGGESIWTTPIPIELDFDFDVKFTATQTFM